MTDPTDPPAIGTMPGTAPNTPATRPEELPPVEPPSAGFIVQLFLIPALIVAAVIGVWALFGKLAHSETDWRQLVSELGSSNEHRRWRAALGLAQVLRNEQLADGTDGTALADRPEVAEALTALLRESLASNATLDGDFKHQEFLARTLGSLNANDTVLPVLGEVLQKNYSEDQGEGDHRAVHKSALMALAMIAGREYERQTGTNEAATEISPAEDDIVAGRELDSPTITDGAVLEQLRLAAQDPDPAIRHLTAFVLGLVSGPDAIKQLQVMLLDGDRMTRANAAVALARNGRTDGVETFGELLATAAQPMDRAEFVSLSAEQQQETLAMQKFEEPIILRNTIRAVAALWPQISEADRSQLATSLSQIAADHAATDIRMQARALLDDVQ